MKIRHWLMISYIVVMVLPLVALYLLYSLLTAYDREQDLIEYMEAMQTISPLESVLNDGSLYTLQSQGNYDAVRELSDDSTWIRLYRYDGILLFSSLEDPVTVRWTRVNVNQLYRQVSELQKNLTTYTMKQPVVVENGKLAGFYEITIRRDDWLRGVQNHTVVIGGALAAFLILLYAGAVYLLHRKLNRPLLRLQKQMSAFADGRRVEQITPAKDEIGALQLHFVDMKDKIERSQLAIAAQQKEKETMLAALSHDLKTPLTVIRAYTEELLGDKVLTEQEKQEYQAILHDKLYYMQHLIDDLSMYAALQASGNRLHQVEVEGDELFEMLLSGYDEPSVLKGVRLVTVQQITGSYYVDVKQMIRIADNLVSNAIRHTPAGGQILLAAISSGHPLPVDVWSDLRIELEAWRENDTLLLVQNDGDSIPEAIRDAIFEPFVQGEASRATGGSSGLGLSIAKLLVELHDGAIRLWSIANYGTLIACRIPERKR